MPLEEPRIIPWQWDLILGEQLLINNNASNEKELDIQQSNNAHISFWTKQIASLRKNKINTNLL